MEVVTAERAYRAVNKLISQDVEEFWALALGPRKELLDVKMIFRGTVDFCLVYPRDIFRFACERNASSFLVVHNHPSGDLMPSGDDLRLTEQLVQASSLMSIPLVDHVIVSKYGYVSLRAEGWCQFEGDHCAPPPKPTDDGSRSSSDSLRARTRPFGSI